MARRWTDGQQNVINSLLFFMQARIILHAIWCAKFIISTHFYTFLIVATSSVTQALILMVLDIFVANLVVCSGVALERTAFLIAQRTVQCGIRRGAAVGMAASLQTQDSAGK